MEATVNPMVTTGSADELQDQLSRSDIVEVANRGEVGRMEMQQLPGWMFESEQWLDKDMELGTYSRSLAGIRDQGEALLASKPFCPLARCVSSLRPPSS